VRYLDRACWTDAATLDWVEVVYADGPSERYVLVDRLDDPAVARGLLEQFRARAVVGTDTGATLTFRPTHLFEETPFEHAEPIAPMRGEQSNTSIRFGDVVILKLFRRVHFGPNPDVEIGWFLTEHTHFRGAPALVGSLEYLTGDGLISSLALLQRFEPNRGDAWTNTLARLGTVLDGRPMAESVDALARLGQTSAELHVALGSGVGDFAAEPIDADDVEQWRQAIHDELRAAADALLGHGIDVVDRVALLARANGIVGLIGARKTRHHGDYHLGQVLERHDGSFVIIDFEGEPSKPLAQRREKRSPLRDVAGMLRSFDYARNTALRTGGAADPRRARRAAEWYAAVREAFLSAYLETLREHAAFLVPADVDGPLAALELEKAAYEVLYELNNRPDWLPIPLTALTSA
jgi:trehalose synthase-fused probable maltokinase